MSNLIKIIVFALIAGVAVFANFFLENSQVNEALVLNEEGGVESNVVFRTEDGEFEFSDFGDSDFGDSDFRVDVGSGRFWANFAFSDLDFNLWIGDVVLIPVKGVFDLDFDGDVVGLDVYDGDVYVGLAGDGFSRDQYYDIYDEGFINTLLVPRGNRVSIALKKVTAKLEPLLPSKLVKEFKYGAISESMSSEDWVVDNLNLDKRLIEEKRRDFVLNIDRSSKAASGFVKALTFIPEKQKNLALKGLFASIDQAIFYFNNGEEKNAKDAMGQFKVDLSVMDDRYLKSKDYADLYDSYVDSLMFFDPSSAEYEVLQLLLDQNAKDGLGALRTAWFNVYQSLDDSSKESEKALDRFYYQFQVAISFEDPRYRQFLLYYNQLINNLFLRHDVFYKDVYFALKESIEDDLLELYDGQLRDELLQTFVNDKITFLRRLKRNFFLEKVKVAEAKKIFRRLMEGARDLLPSGQSAVAVIELFEKQLADIDDFWGYLSSPEYHTSFYGSDHEERYEAYLDERGKILGYGQFQKDLFGEEVELEQTVEEVLAEVKANLEVNEDLTGVEVLGLEDPNDRYVDVNGVLGGYPFEAVYDRDTDLLSEVYVYEKLVTERPLLVGSLYVLVQDLFAELEESEVGEEEEVSIESIAQRRARLYVSELLSDLNFVVELDSVTVLDAANGVYRVDEVFLFGYEDVIVTFDFLVNGELATNLFYEDADGARVIAGEFSMDDLLGLLSSEQRFQELVEEPSSQKIGR